MMKQKKPLKRFGIFGKKLFKKEKKLLDLSLKFRYTSINMKIAINTCYGGFSLSKKACKELGLKSGYDSIERNNPKLIEVIEKLGKDANGECANMKYWMI